ncbi:hypothetical protein ACLKA7_006135 [Drosophila subpalustris]
MWLWRTCFCLLPLLQLGQGLEVESESDVRCVSPRLIERHRLNPEIYANCPGRRHKRRVDATFHGKPKPRSELLASKMLSFYNLEQTTSLVALVNKIAKEYLAKCPPVIYYDRFVARSKEQLLKSLFKTIPITFYHGDINENYEPINRQFNSHIDSNCKSYILFLSDPLMARKILGPQTESRVVLVSTSSQWKLRDFLSSEYSSNIVNLLVIGESLMSSPQLERPYVLYTHKLYADGLGSNTGLVLTSWIKGALSRPHINLFPPKFQSGFAGHRFQVSAADQPPFIFRIKTLDASGMGQLRWDGIEMRLLDVIAKRLNFSVDITETPMLPTMKSAVDNIQFQIGLGRVDIGMSGIYMTEERLKTTDMSVGHSRDCAAFITLASKALPKYRAIMGPFQWPVWVALICVYLGGVFPIVFTDRLTLSHLMGNWGEIENMFWYVFGMFTNAFTFNGKYSWSNTQKTSTRLLIGSYWLFTIIITSCYTGSIIAFVTLPAFPDTVDSVLDLLGLFFRVCTLDNGGWETWFQSSTHEATSKLYKKMEFVGSLEEGIGNVTQSFFWNYAFLGSKARLEYLVQSNYSTENLSRRSALHLSEECFALFQIGFVLPRDSVYKRKIDAMIMIAQESGLMIKLGHEVSWAMQRSSNGRLLQASASPSLREIIQEERQLTTADTEGMFLLMGIGYFIGAVALLSEIVGGITNKCRQIINRSRKSVSSTFSSRGSSAVERTSAEQVAHDERKAARRHASEDASQRLGFGVRELNLTRRTFRELYNSNRQDPESDFQCNSDEHTSSTDLNEELPADVCESLEGLDEFIANLESIQEQNNELDEDALLGSHLDPEQEDVNHND